MQELVNIFIKSIFIDNMVFAYFLGMCSYLGVSKTVSTSVGMGFAVIFVLGITVPINYLLENYVLREGMTLGDIILTAGGVSINATDFRAEISRIYELREDENIFTKIFTFDLINNKEYFKNRDDNKNNLNFLLMPSDIIIIRNAPIGYKQEKKWLQYRVS